MIDYAKALNEAQYAAVTSEAQSVLVVAGAGSGKTRTIVYRLARLAETGTDPASILLLTFTRKAAKEMLDRAEMLLPRGFSGVQGGTFHAFAYSVLRRHHPAWLGDRAFTVMDSGDITAALKQCRDTLRLGKGDRAFPKTQTIAGLLSKARNKEEPLADILSREAFQLLPYADDLARLGRAYDEYRKDKGLMDYDDLLFELERLLETDAEAALPLRRRFRHVLVDEYQDTNLVQARLVRLIAAPAGDGSPPARVMAVGDEAQSIYAFRGANVRNILDFPSFFPGTQIVRLEENYRSVQPVLDVANSLLEHAAESFRKRLFTRRKGGEAVRLFVPMSDQTQANMVVRRVRELLDRFLPEEIAVLFRAGFHSYNLELALNQAGIPFRKYGGLRYTEAAHVKDCLAFARLVLNPFDLPAFARVAAMHPGIGPRTVEKLHAILRSGDGAALEKALARHRDLADDLAFVNEIRTGQDRPDDILSAVLEHYEPRMAALYPEDWPHRKQGIEEVIQMAAGYNELDCFLADLTLESPEEDDTESAGRIVLSTVHSAKGLEWNAVLLIDLVEERFPSRHALARPEAFEEERRLMYVACTRARKVLDLYAPATIYSRAERGTQHAVQSPFLRELEAGLTERWVEGFGGRLSRAGGRPEEMPDKGAQRPVPRFDTPAVTPGAMRKDVFHVQDMSGNFPHRSAVPTAGEPDAEEQPRSSLAVGETASGYCRHRIFGRGKILRRLGPDKVQVNFSGFGLKVILSDYLVMES
ncbi:MAG: ATP-dependent helicase [Desulfovibrio sp.]|nr:ATP-dependent helicase [Desulfovibrio sp.]